MRESVYVCESECVCMWSECVSESVSEGEGVRVSVCEGVGVCTSERVCVCVRD